MTNCYVEISDPTPIHVASRIAEDHDPIGAGSFVESDRIEKSWADEKLVIRSLFHSDRIVSGMGPCEFPEQRASNAENFSIWSCHLENHKKFKIWHSKANWSYNHNINYHNKTKQNKSEYIIWVIVGCCYDTCNIAHNVQYSTTMINLLWFSDTIYTVNSLI